MVRSRCEKVGWRAISFLNASRKPKAALCEIRGRYGGDVREIGRYKGDISEISFLNASGMGGG